MQIVIKLEHIRERDTVSLEDQIKEVLFKLGKEIKIHTIDSKNMILEINYDKAVSDIMKLLESSTCDPQ